MGAARPPPHRGRGRLRRVLPRRATARRPGAGGRRGRALLRLAELIEEHRAELALAVSLGNGKPISEAYGIELRAVIAAFRWYGQLADKLHD
ncbi:aldehyde dehydrogenase family protein [Streptomyces rimosus]|uniref:aldehyde dehydrogenase family protein n=1 Tax=Streptomyces rimosus TaxID=1927 RepID=UPI0004C8AB85|nr:aldehyde dehydrogenase family protein [Streptomyces rimosus]